MDERIKTCRLRLYPVKTPINSLYFSSFVVSVLLVHLHFQGHNKIALSTCACLWNQGHSSISKWDQGPFPSTSNFKRPFVIVIFNLYFKPHDALKRIFLSFLSGENHWEKCERSGKRVACGLRWKTNKPSIKRQLGSLRKQQTFYNAITDLPSK